MKVLVISEYYPSESKPFSGRYIKQQMDAFRKLGHVVDVLIPVRKTKSPLKCVELPNNRYYTVGYKTDRYELTPLQVAKPFAETLDTLCQQEQYDMIALHLTSDTILCNVKKIAKKRDIPFVQHYHGLNVWEEYVKTHRYRQLFYANRRARILQSASAVIGVSEKVSDAIRQKLPAEKVFTVYNGVDTDLFKVQQKDNGDILKIVGVGRLIRTKGYHILVEAVRRLQGKYPNISVEIVGDGPEQDNLTKLIKEASLEDVITLAGRKNYAGVADSLMAADLFVLPSYYEALGCVYLEAMGCGLPAIGVKGMGIDEIIEDGVNGYIVNPENTDDLIGKLERFINLSADERKQMSDKAFQTAKEYTWTNSAITLEKVYKEILAK